MNESNSVTQRPEVESKEDNGYREEKGFFEEEGGE